MMLDTSTLVALGILCHVNSAVFVLAGAGEIICTAHWFVVKSGVGSKALAIPSPSESRVVLWSSDIFRMLVVPSG